MLRAISTNINPNIVKMEEKWVKFDPMNSQKGSFYPIWTHFGPGSGSRVQVQLNPPV